MKKNYFFLLVAVLFLAGKATAQVLPCGTDEMRKKMIVEHPEILKYEADLEAQIQKKLKYIDYSKAARTTSADQTGNPNFWYDIPIVVHVIHDYDKEYLSDDAIFNDLKDWNIVYSMQNPDTGSVIPTYKPWMANLHIRLHLATKDPYGRPTKGITRHRSYLTYTGGEEAKFDDWPNTSYVNIWVVRLMSSGNQEAAAYATPPASGAGNPIGDGIISLYDYFADAYDGATYAVSKTIPHEMGHIFNLEHPWGNTNNPDVACGDDGVDDTPPTRGHLPGGCSATALFDTACAENYYKIYTDIHGNDSLVNYPDTVNSQNIMDYTYCARMFTKGQAARMHAALNSDVAGRNNLWDSTNLVITGALAPRPDLKPIPEFSATPATGTLTEKNYMDRLYYFAFPGNTTQPVTFRNESWNDTVTAVNWQFGGGASPATSSSTTSVGVTFNNPGWADIKMTVSGNNSGDTTVDFPRSVFVANTTATPGIGYYEEFSGPDTAQWPMFNYYNNEFKWQSANVGYYDNNSVMYAGFDSRVIVTSTFFISPFTGQPTGDVDDLFSVPLDLSGYAGPCSLNFYYSGASRTGINYDINDTLEIKFATGKQNVWTPLAIMAKSTLCNKGGISTAYTPTSPSDWALFSVDLPPAARTSYTVFRFRYKPGALVFPSTDASGKTTYATSSISSGNNFYMDRFTVSPWAAGIGDVKMGDMDVIVAPNPSKGDAYVIVKDMDNTSARVVVTDITGKVVFTANQQVVSREARILIPHSAISVPGLYLVQTSTGNQAHTQKLVVE